MHRTQIYFEEDLFAEVKKAALNTNLSVSAYIRRELKKNLDAEKDSLQKAPDFSDFSGRWQDYDISQEDIWSKAWK